MFGRLRPPPSPPDCLERYPAKIIKDDPLSVYESTLLKLKQGSTRLETSSGTEGEETLSPSSSLLFPSDTQGDTHDLTLFNGSDAMAIDSCESSKQLKNKSPSVVSMFSKYKNHAQARDMKTDTQE